MKTLDIICGKAAVTMLCIVLAAHTLRCIEPKHSAKDARLVVTKTVIAYRIPALAIDVHHEDATNTSGGACTIIDAHLHAPSDAIHHHGRESISTDTIGSITEVTLTHATTSI
jgi:hypothetical protein